ncbi:helix-turn-helix transcriptional regulator [Paenibacillus sp. 19GGS1-52]|uniref:winged helix-turn-helix domain-containing protein n=1 Tax=Paenibacillus sp. 19GGS1-52 TaxID=2758563 RepID=UPI001EFB5869|nr:winged helix-turn-helix domain-containing protein [Paenibacillus sp. 19GGS1-52]ULO08274.1 helix-turn-helix transcriptional regulator [Paenibacillus sp. 19GGS1-52]
MNNNTHGQEEADNDNLQPQIQLQDSNTPTPLPVTPEQDKLLESALRIKIMHALAGEPLTSKQVAEDLQKTPGNIHYHIIKLFEGGLLDLVRTEVTGGIVQKFYRSKATWFRSANFSGFQFQKEDTVEHFTTRLTLSERELENFQQELKQFISIWESKITHGEEYGVDIVIGRLNTDSTPSLGGESLK